VNAIYVEIRADNGVIMEAHAVTPVVNLIQGSSIDAAVARTAAVRCPCALVFT
jgi:hypothetical protein